MPNKRLHTGVQTYAVFVVSLRYTLSQKTAPLWPLVSRALGETMSGSAAQIADALISLVPVIGGAVIGVLGGLAGTRYAHSLKVIAESKFDRRRQLEKLVTEVYEVEVWVKKEEEYYLFGGQEVIEQSPISKIEAISALHFPELQPETEGIKAAYMTYKGWMLKGAHLRHSSPTKIIPREHTDSIGSVYNPLIEARDRFVARAKIVGRQLAPS